MFQVNVVGDGRSEVMAFGNEMLDNLKGIMVTGEDLPLPAPVGETGKTLASKVSK